MPSEYTKTLIRQGKISQADYDAIVRQEEERIKSEPGSVHSIVSSVQNRTEGMQMIDKFSLDKVKSLETKITELETRIAALEGGTA